MIARVFYLRGLIETWGRGTLKIARLMQEAGLEPPRVAVGAGSVVLTFDKLAGPKRQTPEKTRVKTPGKTPDVVLALLRSNPGMTMAQLAQRLGKSVSAIERATKKLREQGRLKRVGPDKGGHWEAG
ncbi:MAG: winged helix-turn-helix transcriptional regulator [Rhodoferax sp.]|nr:winged helix-turn-helix transcriptional regulator [Rhodoferax sp.]